MLEKYLKILFSYNLKKNINVLLIIIILLLLSLLFFGNFNLVEGNSVKNPRKGDPTPLVGDKQIQSFTEKMVKAQNY
tara:strand:- start:2327 stop:2557 length:231 start_codon:yes stop_codon:yes gene_type:complete